MNNYEFRSITIDDLPVMAELLIGRQNLETKEYPFLNNSCLNVNYVMGTLEKLIVNIKVIGIGAFVNDELVGYIMGEIIISNRVGRYAAVPYEGIAIKTDQSSELIRYLYAKVSVLWLEQGCFNHSIYVPIANQVYYEGFLQLSFSIEQVHAVMNIEEYIPFENVADVDIRLANKMDSEVLGKMSSIITKFQNTAPIFIPVLPEVLAKIKEGFKRLVDDDDDVIALLIAEEADKELGFQLYEMITSNLMTPDDGIELSVAGTYYSQMRRGIGKKLMNEGCKIIKEKGYSYIKADWRITNLASSTFWPKCGFRPVVYRMERYIDRNYAWANSNNPSIKQL
ncbi:GNAT family N-acetyltransferase [Haloplasma contractile]|uniref:Acetyltransferase domain containing protein n=1 Tax=Haloplasma contractile SSD-17B TaxID=1033810 RepID=F7PVV4_9MOLU|nr:GNAT family N-acetyltransferase [Haloplasma contractile]ERJ12725.1 Acetyltransferase domain containing protein [Haloplasma contractile SSD-17B]